MATEDTNWVTYSIWGATAVILSWATTGCIFGNYKEEKVSPPVDHFTGYYVTEAQSLSYSATTASGARLQSGSISDIPVEIGKYFSNPMALIMQNLETGQAALTSTELLSNKQTPYIPSIVRSDGSISYKGNSNSFTFWKDPSCKASLELLESGYLTLADNISNPPGNTYPLSGRLQLKLKLTTVLEGECTATLQHLVDCYQDASVCDGSTSDDKEQAQALVYSIFNPFFDSHVLSPSELPTLTDYAYEVVYH